MSRRDSVQIQERVDAQMASLNPLDQVEFAAAALSNLSLADRVTAVLSAFDNDGRAELLAWLEDDDAAEGRREET
jgi:hypothetical protein